MGLEVGDGGGGKIKDTLAPGLKSWAMLNDDGKDPRKNKFQWGEIKSCLVRWTLKHLCSFQDGM